MIAGFGKVMFDHSLNIVLLSPLLLLFIILLLLLLFVGIGFIDITV